MTTYTKDCRAEMLVASDAVAGGGVALGGSVTPFEVVRRPGPSGQDPPVITVSFPVSPDDLLGVLWVYLCGGVEAAELDSIDDAELLSAMLLFGLEATADRRRAMSLVPPSSDLDDVLAAARSRVAKLCGLES